MLNDVSLHQLEIFCAVIETGAFGRAAQRLMIGQPSVSIQVQRLEKTLGLELFIRRGRSTKPTEAAQVVYAAAQRLLLARGDLSRAVEELKAGVSGSLCIGASTTIGDYLLPDLLGDWRRSYPNVELTARVSNSREVVKWIAEDAVDIGFLGESADLPEIEARQWLEDRVVVIAPPSSRLATGTHSPEELRSESFIFRERGSATRAIAEACLVAAGITPRVFMTLGSNEAVKRAVAAGLGISMLSSEAIGLELRTGQLVVARVSGMDCRRTLEVARRKGRQPTRLMERFIAFSDEWCARRSGGGQARPA